MSVSEIIVMSALCVVPVVFGMLLVIMAIVQKTGTTDVEEWSQDDDYYEDEEHADVEGGQLHVMDGDVNPQQYAEPNAR